MTRLISSSLLIAILAFSALLPADDRYTSARQALVKEIISDVQETSIYLDKDALDPRVMDAMAKVPRHEFVPFLQKPYSYQNRPLPIGHGQTISQPYIVAIMTDLLKPKAGDRVLEIGTGSGYQAAILSEIVSEVYTIEIIGALGEQAEEHFKRLNYRNIQSRIGDGYYGWESAAPFDGIVVTAAASHVPPPLIEQLKPGGRMVIPVGSPFLVQHLVIVEKHTDGKITSKQILPVRFVPLTGGH
ncbi:MAG: protein-L-isoaspartate(D-aspartate) O-methyltransferase [Gammaproteobacteria bacterium]|nr:protein-L-isoaspartate(D-aspartate) O-methyltransferase [Gammaproteobacteria bacterium]